MYIIQEVTLTSQTTVRVFSPHRETDGEVLCSRAQGGVCGSTTLNTARRHSNIGASAAPTVASAPGATPRERQLAPIVPHRRAAAAWLDPPGALPRTGRAHLHYRGLRLHYSRIGASHGTRSPRQVFKGYFPRSGEACLR